MRLGSHWQHTFPFYLSFFIFVFILLSSFSPSFVHLQTLGGLWAIARPGLFNVFQSRKAIHR